ncbi:MAG: IS630 family transposase [Smithella sp.]
MPRSEKITIEKHMSREELESRIKTLETDAKILKRLYFVKFRYEGESVEKSVQRVGVTRNEGYIWQRRWNKKGYDGLIPQYAGGRPMKLTPEEFEKLKDLLREKTTWTTEEVRTRIHQEFKVEYTLKQVRIILKKLKMAYGKPFTLDYRRPNDAELLLKNLPEIKPEMIIGFLDETSPQTTANTQRFWSFGHPTLVKNTTKFRANTFGFYSINGSSVLEFHEHSKKEDVRAFLQSIRRMNPTAKLVILLDNFRSHHANITKEYADKNGITLVFLPPYSPDLNPIEFIWKSIRRIISRTFIRDLDHLKQIILDAFGIFGGSPSFAKAWIAKFLGNKFSIKY